jgi:outer membrane protein assembly factor BamE (lipoprotein component of BamABCDE complex)
MLFSDMRSKAALLALADVAMIAVMLGWAFYRNSRIASRYQRVSVGASVQQVLRLLGTPSWMEPCGQSFGTRELNCTEYIYRNSFAPLVPEYYSVRFDTNGHVVDKYVYESP